mmetsp:Transcript_27092/g.56744  ORF Transcript_27092/g.56744 Transcript_27092/m.56744 type:complete len:237 (+) Transcript_27092:318-1028(+)
MPMPPPMKLGGRDCRGASFWEGAPNKKVRLFRRFDFADPAAPSSLDRAFLMLQSTSNSRTSKSCSKMANCACAGLASSCDPTCSANSSSWALNSSRIASKSSSCSFSSPSVFESSSSFFCWVSVVDSATTFGMGSGASSLFSCSSFGSSTTSPSSRSLSLSSSSSSSSLLLLSLGKKVKADREAGAASSSSSSSSSDSSSSSSLPSCWFASRRASPCSLRIARALILNRVAAEGSN